MTTSYICVDVETTGLNPGVEKLIEIGAVKVVDGKAVEHFQSLVQPGRPVGQHIEALTGITDEMLADAPTVSEVVPVFRQFCEELPLVGHNLMFDFSFLKKAMVNANLDFERSGIDTLRIARRYLPELESRRLGFLCEHFGFAHTAHRALGDAEATSALYQKLCQLFYEKAQGEECKVFLPAPLVYNVKKEKAITIAQKEQVTKYCQKLGIVLNWDLNRMTRSEASRFLEKHRLAYKERK